MRERGPARIYATRPYGSPSLLAKDTMRFGHENGSLWWYEGEPVTALGYIPLWPGVASVWAFGTSKWPRVLPVMTRFVLKGVIPLMIQHGMHRVECRALKERKDTKRWLLALGAHEEATLKEFGKNRETFVSYVWSDYEVQHVKH
jgi:hypothetical protein